MQNAVTATTPRIRRVRCTAGTTASGVEIQGCTELFRREELTEGLCPTCRQIEQRLIDGQLVLCRMDTLYIDEQEQGWIDGTAADAQQTVEFGPSIEEVVTALVAQRDAEEAAILVEIQQEREAAEAAAIAQQDLLIATESRPTCERCVAKANKPSKKWNVLIEYAGGSVERHREGVTFDEGQQIAKAVAKMWQTETGEKSQWLDVHTWLMAGAICSISRQG